MAKTIKRNRPLLMILKKQGHTYKYGEKSEGAVLRKSVLLKKISILKIRQTLSNKHTNKDALEENLTRCNERKSSFKLKGWSYFLRNIKRNLLKTLDINCAYSFTNATATWMRLTKSLRPVLSATG